MNDYLLFAGYNYYPSGGMSDLQGDFESLDDAVREVKIQDWDWFHIVLKSDMSVVCNKFNLIGMK